MAHSHHHSHSHTQEEITKGLTFAFWMNLCFSVFEIIGGWMTNSTAIIADAFHDFMDAVAIGLAVFFEKFSKKKGNAIYSYGYRRFSLLSALILSVSLIAGAVLMLVASIHSFYEVKEVNGKGMFILSIVGIAVNGLAFLKLHHSHSKNNNQRAVTLHLLEDVLGWIVVLVGSVIIFFTGWNWVDGVLTLGIAGFIGFNAISNMIQTMRILLQYVPENVDIVSLRKALFQIPGIQDIHDLHVWSLDGNYTIATLHVVLSETHDKPFIQGQIAELMQSFHIQHPTIQIEVDSEHCDYCNCELKE